MDSISRDVDKFWPWSAVQHFVVGLVDFVDMVDGDGVDEARLPFAVYQPVGKVLYIVNDPRYEASGCPRTMN